jgi:phosphatidylglycerophosphatase A
VPVQAAPTILLLFLGVWIAGRAEDLSGVKDARPIVIDEVVGMWISLVALPPRMEYWLAAFVLFRVFDVVKPFPADRAQRLGRGWGIMLDDVFAGIYANAVLQLFIKAVQ